MITGIGAAARPQTTENLDAVEMWQTEVEHDEGVVFGGQGGIGLVAAIDAIDDVVVASQQAGDPCRQLAVVFGKQYSHLGRSIGAARSLPESR